MKSNTLGKEPTKTVTWNVERESDGGFVMWIPGTEPRIRARDLSELKKQGCPNGIVDDVYGDVCLQLENHNKATAAVPIFKFYQVLG